MNISLRSICAAAALLACSGLSIAKSPPGPGPGAVTGTWQPLAHPAPFTGALLPILLTDGSVLIQEGDNVDPSPYIVTNHWWKLTPDENGDYVNGTWTQLHDAAVDHAPLFYSSAVLADGRVVVCGGEYNNGAAVWTTRSEIYNPVTNLWADITPPAGFTKIGDSQCVVLPNGKFVLTNAAFSPAGQTPLAAILDPTTLTWTAASVTGKEQNFDEENWTLLPDGTILTVDVVSTPNAEKYIPWDDNWVPAGTTPNAMTDSSFGYEMGPAVLRFDGSVLAFGANQYTAIYTPPATPTDPGSWTSGPTLPGLGIADGPCCLLPNGNVLFAASPPPIFSGGPMAMYETDGVNLFAVPAIPRSGVDNCFNVNFLVLPNGQVMEADSSTDIQIYTPVGSPSNAWRPTITNAPSSVLGGNDYFIQGTQFNGLSQTNCYGDDWSNASNYPIIRIKNNSSGHVFYCRTHDHSTMGVATGSATVSTHFEVPAGIELGASTIEVVANGIPSTAQAIFVGVPNTPPVADAGADQTIEATGPTTNFTLDGTGSTDADNDSLTYEWFDASNTSVGTGSTLNLSAAVGVYTYTLKVDDGTDSDTDTVQITIQDTTPPQFGAISNISQTATSASGNIVTFSSPVAVDLVDGNITGTCVPASGSLFGPGDTTVNVSATDVAGNTGHASFHVFITFSWSGFLSPFPKEPFKTGSNIPIKFKLTGASAGITNLVARGYWAPVVSGVPGAYTLIGNFTYSAGNYQLNWKTTRRAKGTYRIKADLGDGVLRTVDVILK